MMYFSTCFVRSRRAIQVVLLCCAAIVCALVAKTAWATVPTAPGGPILLITDSSDNFGEYYQEILFNEGFNNFSVSTIGTVTATTLANYDIAILAAMPLTTAQVTMFSDWVAGGGHLIAMRPDKKLATLLGLGDAQASLADRYMLIDTSKAPGNGLVGDTIQFHGTADLYTLNGAQRLATLYSDAVSPTVYPAVSLMAVGSNGGQAAAFSYDLARSIIYTRQGNPAWATQERDGFTPKRADDKFFGNAANDPQSDWVDLNKVAIPQADEHQRLLANLILTMNLAKKPLPRFWYFPRGEKAVVLMTGDDHGNNGTEARFNHYRQLSPANCSVANWECIRGTSYIYHWTPILNATASAFDADGFEISLHLTTGCDDFTLESLRSNYAEQLAGFTSAFPGLPAPLTQRHHCIVWSDWANGAVVELENGMRLDTSYYFWPPSWVVDRPGFFNGSGMPMRFANVDGSRIDVFLTETQMTDESGQSYPFTSDTLLSRALGADGYYGVFTANAHTDYNNNDGTYSPSDEIIASAVTRGVPVITARQLLTWLDGRSASKFTSLSMNGSTLDFAIAPDAAAVGLQAMLPYQSANGVLTELTLNGSPIGFSTETIKGIAYALFPAAAGAYAATYAGDSTPPTVISTSPINGATGVSIGALVSAAFSENIDPQTISGTTVQLRDASGNSVASAVTYDSQNKSTRLTPGSPLAAATTYTATIKGGANGVKDLSGNALAVDYVWSFTTTTTSPCAQAQPCRIWPTSPTPGSPSVVDPNGVELGVKFTADIAGYITGIRFYKGSGNSGTHVGSLWSSGGSLLARATFSNETSTGWQQVNFATPVAVTANTTYVASYFAPNGNYAGDNNFFATSGVDTEPLHALRDGTNGGNGVYVYTSTPSFPSNTWSSSNYWVDVDFSTNAGSPSDTTPPTVTATTPTAGATGVGVGSAVAVTFSEALDPATINGGTFTLQGSGSVSATVTYDAAAHTATLTPNSLLAASTTYSATVSGGSSGVKDLAGNALASTFTWSFTTAAADTTPPTIVSRAPANSAIAVALGSVVTATFSEAMNAATISGSTIQLRDPSNALVPASVSYSAGSLTATLTPTSLLQPSTTYTATVVGGTGGVSDVVGNALAASASWSFTTAAGASSSCPCTIWNASVVPTIIQDSDSAAVELGVKFRSNVDGYITGIRFYKGSNNTGTHVGTLWSSAGQQLAQATFANETASGWQQVTFTTPVAVTANTVYVASYHTNVGRYSADTNYFGGSGLTNGPLYALQNGESGGNGVYAYNATPTFPASTYQATNYWVDVVFTESTGPDTTPPSIVSNTPVDGATNVFPGATVSVTFSEAMDSATISGSTIALNTGGANVAATVSYNVSTRTATITPSSPLALSSSYGATVVGGSGGVKDVAGNALASNASWSFTTAATPSSIAEENALPGTPQSQWDISGSGDQSIQGFTTNIGYNRGETASFKVDVASSATGFHLDIYRLGYYGGNGARLIDTVPASQTVKTNQPACQTQAATGLVDCGNWSVSASWPIPPDAVSGIYFAKAVREDTGGASHIFFIVRDDSSQSDILFKTSDSTWQAYNQYGGGNSFYTGGPGTNPSRAYKVSYNRPFTTRSDVPNGQDWVMYGEFPMVRWLERNGYDLSYTTTVDIARRGSLIGNHRIFLSVGHDEYWSAEERTNVETARAAGVHLGFFSGNAMYWKTRWEPSIISGSPTGTTCQANPLTDGCYRTLVSYKESHNSAKIDPSSTWTGLWRDSRSYAAAYDGNNPENALMGTIFMINDTPQVSLNIPAAYAGLRFWRNTGVAGLAPGQTATLGEDVVGYEFDLDLDNGHRPAGLMRLSETLYPNAPTLQDETGSNYAAQDATHTLTLYKASSGALVFAAGTVQWAWGLDGTHDGPTTPQNADMQQATLNLFADMGVQPQTMQANLQIATASADATKPTTTITSPANGSSIQIGAAVTVSGTAADSGGGVVAAVEVSVDGGSTWRPATGLGNWTYIWTPGSNGSRTIVARAVDDSGNIQSPGTSVTVTVGSSDTTPPTVSTTTPVAGATNVAVASSITATFSEDMTAATISGSSMLLQQQGSTSVPATVTYSSSTRRATLTPTIPLTSSTNYTATVVGGASGVKDLAGNPLATNYAWSFTTGAPAPVDVTITGTGSQDGWVLESSETSNLGGTFNATTTGSAGLRVGDATNDRQYKAIVSFDTSTIPANATIVSATLRLQRGTVTGTSPFGTFGQCLVDVSTGGFGGNTALAVSDFQAPASAVAVASMTNAATNGTWSEGVLNASGLAAINTLGVTQFRVYFELDDNDDGGNDYIGYYPADTGTASRRPQLVIRYMTP